MYLILLCFGTLFGLGAFFLLAGLLRLPTSASTKAVLTVTSRGKSQKGSINAILFDMAARLSPLVHLDSYKRKKLEAQLKSAEIKMSPETYIAAAWVKAGLIALLIIPALLIFPILAPVIVFLAVAVYFKEQKRADEIVQQRREEIEAELPRFVNTIEQELRASRDVLNILKSYQRNAGHAMKRELEITIADMASGNEENALTRMESRIGSTMLSDVVRGLISVKRGDMNLFRRFGSGWRNTLSRRGWLQRLQRSRWMAAARFIPNSVRSGMARMESLILIPLRRRNCASSPISNILPSCPPSRNRCCPFWNGAVSR